MKNFKDVDWNKAPEGATHYNKDCTFPWLKETPASFYDEEHGYWVRYNPDSLGYYDPFKNAVKRPQEWNGSGLPLVGVVCEYFWGEGKEWRKCEVVAHHHAKVVAIDVLDSAAVCLTADLFRPIKAPEQPAAEERRQAIEEMLNLVDCHSTFGDVMGALYDAGYRKKNGGEEMSNGVVRDSQMFRMPPSAT